jgi:hypothetical protein
MESPTRSQRHGRCRSAAGSRASQRSTKTLMAPGPSRSQRPCRACGRSQAANPLESSVTPMPAWWRDGWPLVAVAPDLARIPEPGAHLDEGGAEVGVPHRDVGAGHPTVGLGERPPWPASGSLALGGRPDPLELLRHPDRGHPEGPGGGLAVKVGSHHRELVVVLAERHPREVVGLRGGGDRPAEALPDLVAQCRPRKPVAQGPDKNATTWALVCSLGRSALSSMRSRHWLSNATCPSRTSLTVTTCAPMTASHLHQQGDDHPPARSQSTSSTTLTGRSEAKPHWYSNRRSLSCRSGRLHGSGWAALVVSYRSLDQPRGR